MAYLIRDTLTGRVVRTFARTRLADASYMASELNRTSGPGRYEVRGWGVDRLEAQSGRLSGPHRPVPAEPTLPADFS